MSQGGTPVSISATDRREPGTELYELIRQGRSFSGREKNCAFLNLRDGTFADISSSSGWDFADDGRAITRVDWDLDGDLDFWIANRNGPQIRFLKNDLPRTNHFLKLKLVGSTCNRDAVGARVTLTMDDEAKQNRSVRAGDGFMAQSSKWLHFGVGKNQSINEITVHWPDGKKESFDGVEADGHYMITQGEGAARAWKPPTPSPNLGPQEIEPVESSELARVVSLSQLPIPIMHYQTFDNELKYVGRLDQEPNGKPIQPVVLNLWASWCKPCKEELEKWTREKDRLLATGAEVITLSVDGLDDDPAQGVKAAASFVDLIESSDGETNRYPFRSGMAPPQTVNKLQLLHDHLFDWHRPLPVPVTFLIDGRNQIAVAYRGPVDVDRLVDDIENLKMTPLQRLKIALPFDGKWYFHGGRLHPLDFAWRMDGAGYPDELGDYFRRYGSRMKDHREYYKLLVLVGNAHLSRGRIPTALQLYEQSLSINENYADALNNAAWIFATSSDSEIADGTKAVEYAERAAKQPRGSTPSMLDTLAAAYASNKQFKNAVRVAEDAIEAAVESNLPELAEKIESRLSKYRQNRPHRVP